MSNTYLQPIHYELRVGSAHFDGDSVPHVVCQHNRPCATGPAGTDVGGDAKATGRDKVHAHELLVCRPRQLEQASSVRDYPQP